MTLIQLRLPATALSLVIALALLSACGRDAGTAPPVVGPGVDSPPGSAAADESITAGVKLRLANDATASGLDIQVVTREGRVLLRGIAPDTAVRHHVADVARTVAGVVSVDNDLSVQLTHQ